MEFEFFSPWYQLLAVPNDHISAGLHQLAIQTNANICFKRDYTSFIVPHFDSGRLLMFSFTECFLVGAAPLLRRGLGQIVQIRTYMEEDLVTSFSYVFTISHEAISVVCGSFSPSLWGFPINVALRTGQKSARSSVYVD